MKRMLVTVKFGVVCHTHAKRRAALELKELD